jgi:hypothetical protein
VTSEEGTPSGVSRTATVTRGFIALLGLAAERRLEPDLAAARRPERVGKREVNHQAAINVLKDHQHNPVLVKALPSLGIVVSLR